MTKDVRLNACELGLQPDRSRVSAARGVCLVEISLLSRAARIEGCPQHELVWDVVAHLGFYGVVAGS